MSLYTVYYFPFYVRADPIKMLLEHAKVEYKDVVVTFPEWPALKPTMTNNQLPCLELQDGTQMGESNDILRFLGTNHGYYPQVPELALQADQLCDAYLEILGKIYKPQFAAPEEHVALFLDIFGNILPTYLATIEPICAKGEFLVGDSLTTADFWIGGLYTNFFANKAVGFAPEKWAALLELYPAFKAYGERFAASNAEYLAKRASYPL